MRDFISDYFPTLSSRRQERVQDLLAASRVNKENLDSIVAELMDMAQKSPIVIDQESFNGLIEAAKFDSSYRDAYRYLVDLYDVSNTVSTLLDTHTGVLTSEIKSLEDEIDAMTKAIDNYAFSLADNGFYDYSFIETFNDENMMSEQPASTFTDRSGVKFTDEEAAYVNSAAGVLTLSPGLETSYSLVGQITNSNCASFITSDTGLQNALNKTVSDGWRVAVSSPRPISSTLPGITKQGAQFQIDLDLTHPSPCDTFVVTPLSDKPFELARLEVFYSDGEGQDSSIVVLSDATQLIDKPTDFGFEMRTVSRVRMIINQPIYSRTSLAPTKAESIHRTFYTEHKQKKNESIQATSGSFKRNQKAINLAFLNMMRRSLNNAQTRIFRSQAPQIDFDAHRGPLSVKNFIRRGQKSSSQLNDWNAKSRSGNILRRMVHEKLFSSSLDSLPSRVVYGGLSFVNQRHPFNAAATAQSSNYDSDKLDAGVDPNMYASSNLSDTKFLDYEYNLGFRNIQIGTGKRAYRGIYVSKSIPADSDSGQVKIKVEDLNYELVGTDRDQIRITSVEYSVTNKSNPSNEGDWIPILSSDSNGEVTGERLFLDEAGNADFRFPASKNHFLAIYKNGYALGMEKYELIDSSDVYSYRGIRLPLKAFGPTDIFTASYSAFGDASFISFADKGFDNTSLASAFDSEGAGQTFNSTANGRTVTLDHQPYIDHDQILDTNAYSATLGFTGSYQPITIIMEDGTVALNQTNYNGLTQNNLSDFGSDTYAYLQSGNIITFNQEIAQRFTVYYQYLPNNLKIRIIMRVNDPIYVTPKVEYVNIKTKTRKANSKKAF